MNAQADDDASDESPEAAFQRIVRDDAERVARRSFRGKFGRLSNDRILGVLRPAAAAVPELARLSDSQLLDRWFEAFGAARKRLR